jgi:deoxycytidylate deaminase
MYKAEKKILRNIKKIAEHESNCKKTSVGCMLTFTTNTKEVHEYISYNKVYANLCNEIGCLRMQKYGEDSTKHRNADDCRSIHAEVAVIGKTYNIFAKKYDMKLYVTRAPCENCAKLIAAAGIKKVFYSGNEIISEMTEEIFSCFNVDTIYLEEFGG